MSMHATPDVEGTDPNDQQTVPLPWIPLSDEDRPIDAVLGWAHARTGLRVTIERTRRPTQMHNARTARDDTGWTARVYAGDGHNARLCPELASKDSARASATAFMQTHSDGDFPVPEPGSHDGEVEWRRS